MGDATHPAASLVCRCLDDIFFARQPGVVDPGRSLGGHLYRDAAA